MGFMDKMKDMAEAGEDKSTQRKAQKEQAAAEKEQAAFRASPMGQARIAKENGDRWFQFEMVASQTDRDVFATMLFNVDTRSKPSSGHGTVLTAIEDEGWELAHTGYVFRETGQVSRDKFLVSGQQVGSSDRGRPTHHHASTAIASVRRLSVDGGSVISACAERRNVAAEGP